MDCKRRRKLENFLFNEKEIFRKKLKKDLKDDKRDDGLWKEIFLFF